MNWTDLEKKAIPAPFTPRLANELDVSNFSEEFTRMIPADSPDVVPPNFDKIFRVRKECLSHFTCNAYGQLSSEAFPAFRTGIEKLQGLLS